MTLARLTRILLAVLGAGLVYALLWPQALGGQVAYLPVSGESMLPGIEDGDLAVVRRSGDYGKGDVVAYRIPAGETGAGAVVIHRITRVLPDGSFETRGDNRKRPDPWHPTPGDVLGQHWYHLPGAGASLTWLRAPLPLALLAGAMAVWISFGFGKDKRADESEDLAPAPEGAPMAVASGLAVVALALVVPGRRRR